MLDNFITHAFKPVAVRIHCLFLALPLLMLISMGTYAQSSTKNVTDSGTPLAISPGTPAGSYALSGFDNINPYNGGLNFNLPLLSIGGRGEAGYTISVPVEQHWTVDKFVAWAACYGSPGCNIPNDPTYIPRFNWWTTFKPGYSPGVMLGRQVGRAAPDCNGCYPETHHTEDTLTRLTFTAADGTEYEFRDQLTDGKPQSGLSCYAPGFLRGKIFVTADGSSATFRSDEDIRDATCGTAPSYFNRGILYPTGYLLLRDGTRYRIESGHVMWMRDRNGNKTTFTYGADPYSTSSGKVTTITDALNRQINISYGDANTPYHQITFSGFNGASRTIRIYFASLSNALRPTSNFTTQTYSQLFPELSGGSNNTIHNPTVLSAIELPDGRQYKLYYNPYGELSRVELPTGGAYEYDYASGVINSGGPPQFGQSGANSYQIYRRAVERRVYPSGGTGASFESKMTFSRPESVTWIPNGQGGWTGTSANTGYIDVDQLDADGLLLSRTRHYYYGSALNSLLDPNDSPYAGWRDGKEYKTEAFAADGLTVLQRVINTWNQRASVSWWPRPYRDNDTGNNAPPNDPRLTQVEATLVDTNQVSKETFDYDQYNNQTDIWQYHYGQNGSGSLARHVHNEYLTVNSVNGAAYDSISTTSDLSAVIHQRSLPVKQSIYDENNIERARTTYEYDNHLGPNHDALKAYVLPISGMDSSFSASYTKRGNVTAITHYLLDQSGNATDSVSSYQQYDIAGNIVKTIAPRGALSPDHYGITIDYSDNFGVSDTEARTNTSPSELISNSQISAALPTKVTNALGHTVYTQYDYHTGKPINIEDANGVVSRAEYNDSLDRQKLVIADVNNLAGKSRAIVNYDDANRIITTQSDLKAYSDGLLKSETVYDGLGRAIETHRYEIGTNYITTKQEYDALGRVKRAYNPSRTTTEDTYGWADTTYDALSRIVKVQTFNRDGASTGLVQKDYRGNQALVTDQDNKKRLSQADALGQLVDVWEITPNDSTNYPEIAAVSFAGQSLHGYLTRYEYDALNNLTKVIQGTQPPRTFAYNSLKQLTDATNPESGHISYQYDEDGNLKHKTDARNVITSYNYDELDRLTSRTYQNDGGLTSSVYYKYDAQPLPSDAPMFDRGASTGKMVAVLYGSSTSSAGSYQGYDAGGRVKQSFQVTHDGQANQTYSFPNYEYDLAGNLKSETYPSGRIVSISYDDAGRLSAVSGQKSGEQPKPYVSQLSYAASGAVKDMQLGNGLWEQTILNSRLQPKEIRLGTTQGGVDRLKLTYEYGTTTNNGNVQSQTIAVPTIGTATGFTHTQSYSYDALNRLAWAEEQNDATQAQVWKQTYAYDRFGNRRIDTGLESGQKKTSDNVKPEDFDNPTLSAANNRIAINQGYDYDAAGNLTDTPNRLGQSKGHKYEFDAENHQVSFDKEPVTTPTVKDATYVYDGDGKRVKKVADGITTVFVYDVSGQLVAEYDTAGSSSAGTSYLTSDMLGTPRVITGSNINDGVGGVKARHDYLPFGEEVFVGRNNSYVADNLKQKFTQKERDFETGLDYFNARYYASRQGRFTSPDPFGPWAMTEQEKIEFYNEPQKWNLYAYVTNSPLKYSDPTGLEKYIGVSSTDEKKIRAAFAAILKYGTHRQQELVKAIQQSDLIIKVASVTSGSGNTGVTDVTATQNRINTERLGAQQALNELTITVDPGTLATQKGIEGTLVHETRHAFHDARAIATFSFGDKYPQAAKDNDIDGFALEYAAHNAYAEYVASSVQKNNPNGQALVNEALSMGVISNNGNSIKVSEKGIRDRLANNYKGLNDTNNRGQTFSQAWGLSPRSP